ncbi:ABC transporter substrate-binding protein [Spirochaetota bacterium]
MMISKYINKVMILIAMLFLALFVLTDEVILRSEQKGSITRVVSLSPAITRQIIDMGAEKLLVGVTSFHPPMTVKVPIVGTLLNANVEKIISLKPHIVFSSEEDNTAKNVEILMASGIRVKNFGKNDSFETICSYYLQLGKILKMEKKAQGKLEAYKKIFNKVKPVKKKLRIAIFVSHKPLQGASNLSYVGKIVEDAGGYNTMRLLNYSYPILSLEHVVMLDPDIIISIVHNGVKDRDFFYKTLKDFSGLKVIKRKSIYTISSDYVCYYTPLDYLKAKEVVAEIISKETKKIKTQNEKNL